MNLGQRSGSQGRGGASLPRVAAMATLLLSTSGNEGGGDS